MKTVTSQVLGTLSQDVDLDDWWLSAPIAIPFFADHRMPIVFTLEPGEDTAFIAEADAAVAHFLRLGEEARRDAAPRVHRNCREFMEAIGQEDDPEEPVNAVTDPMGIWAFVRPVGIRVRRRHRRDRDVYVSINCNCDWEVEHGLLLVFRRGQQLTRVSAFDGHLTEADAYDKPDDDDEMLARFKPEGGAE